MQPQPPSGSEPSRPDLDPAPDTESDAVQSGRKSRTALVVGVAVVVALGATAAAAVRFMSGSDAALLERVPASADVAFNVNLDPAAGQKVNLMRMLGEFPGLGKEQKLTSEVNDMLDEALSQAGLTHEDLDWVGPQVTGFLDIEQVEDPQGAVLVAVDDEQGAQAAIDALVGAAKERGETVTTEDHGGVEVHVSGEEGGGAVALVDGALILASSADVIDDVIGTEPGDSLAASPTYSETLEELPGENLAMVYVNMPALAASLDECDVAVRRQWSRGPGLVARRHRGGRHHGLGRA